LGSQLVPLLSNEFNVIALGSKDVDVSSYDSVSNFFSNNTIDIVINLSGYNSDNFLHKYNESNYSEVEKQIDINIKGTINIVSACLSYMRSNNYGRIILASSVLADHPVISTSIYSGCKGFVDSLTKTVAIENASKNISCNSLQLGYFDGGLTYKIPEEFRNSIKNTIPAKRWGSIDELYNTVKYLIDTGYINGQNINISGGII
jgi:NAD(P)-dependent dehydrogenase (short-subunit alcohol dehydrogenase family)